MMLMEMKEQQQEALKAAESVVAAAERRGGNEGMTASENETYNNHMAKFKSLSGTIKAREEQNTIRAVWPGGRPGLDAPVAGNFVRSLSAPFAHTEANDAARKAETHAPEYKEALHAFLKSGGKSHAGDLSSGADGVGGYYLPGSEQFTGQRLPNGKASAAMYEGTAGGSDAAGGYAVNIPTSQLIVPLAMPDLGIFDASVVIPTATDLKVPQQASFGTSAIKAESNGTIATFGGNDPALQSTYLSAFMVGAARVVSWELLQDVLAFEQFIVEDLLKGQRILEGQLLASGTGTGQPLGVFGNTATGTGSAYELTGTAATDSTLLLNSLFDVTSTLKGAYQANASWVMSRATGLAIRRAQMQANLFTQVATFDPDGTERILGRPVYYDVNSPALPAATNAGVIPILFGDFKAGYMIGVRGGAGINVKILDQPLAMQGQLAILAYRRLDGRIRRSEAIQAVTVSHS
jgi:HK97 family phage major capsid protein